MSFNVYFYPIYYPTLNISYFPTPVTSCIELGNQHFNEKNYQSAIDCYCRVIREGVQNNGEVHKKLGDAHFFSDDYTEAKKCYLKARDLGEDCGELYVNLGLIYYDEEENQKTIESWTNAIGRGVEDEEVEDRLGDAYSKIGDKQQAIIHWEKAIALGKDKPDIHKAIGRAYFYLGFYDEAKQYFEAAASMDPKRYPLPRKLGHISLMHNDEQQARHHYSQAIQQDPNIFCEKTPLLKACFCPPDTPFFQSQAAKVAWASYLLFHPLNNFHRFKHVFSYLHADKQLEKNPMLKAFANKGFYCAPTFDFLFQWVIESEKRLGFSKLGETLKKCMGSFQKQFVVENKAINSTSMFPNIVTELAVEHLEQVRQLKSGESHFITGTVKEKKSTHAICYEIVKQPNGNYAFIIINTGSGISSFHNFDYAGNKKKYCPYYEIADIPEETLCQLPFFEYLMKSFCCHSSVDKVSDFYQEILRLLDKRPSDEALPQFPAPLITIQRGPSCALSTWKAVIRRHLPVAEYKKLMFFIKCKSMTVLHELLSSSFPGDKVGQELLRIAAKEHVKRIEKIKKVCRPEEYETLLTRNEKQKVEEILYKTGMVSPPSSRSAKKRKREEDFIFPRKKQKFHHFYQFPT